MVFLSFQCFRSLSICWLFGNVSNFLKVVLGRCASRIVCLRCYFKFNCLRLLFLRSSYEHNFVFVEVFVGVTKFSLFLLLLKLFQSFWVVQIVSNRF